MSQSAPDGSTTHLIHLLNESIDLLLPIPQITTFNEMLEFPRPKSACGVRELEWPGLGVSISSQEEGVILEDLPEEVAAKQGNVSLASQI